MESQSRSSKIETLENGTIFSKSETNMVKEKSEPLDNELFYKYMILSSTFPLVGLYYSKTCERRLARLGALVGGGISCILYGVCMAAAGMFLTYNTYLSEQGKYAGSIAGQVNPKYYLYLGYPGLSAIGIGAVVVHSSIGNYYRDNGERLVSLAEMDIGPIKRCFLPVVGVLISYVSYPDSQTKFLTGAVGSSCVSIALAPIMFLAGVTSPQHLVTYALLFLLFSIFGGVGLGMFWWKLRLLVLSFQKDRETQFKFEAGGGGLSGNSSPTQSLHEDIQQIAFKVDGNKSNPADDSPGPSQRDDAYITPAPSSHVAIQDYRAQEDDEMDFQNGDLIGIEKDCGDGWAVGQNISKNRKRGVFPLALVTAIVTGPTQNVSRKKTSFLPRTISMKVKL